MFFQKAEEGRKIWVWKGCRKRCYISLSNSISLFSHWFIDKVLKVRLESTLLNNIGSSQ